MQSSEGFAGFSLPCVKYFFSQNICVGILEAKLTFTGHLR